jgi:prevent-host-death family protein
MKIIGVFEAKTHFTALLKEVEQGEEIIITKHGHAVAKIIPTGIINRELIQNNIKKLQIFRQKHTLEGLNWKTLRDEGRK